MSKSRDNIGRPLVCPSCKTFLRDPAASVTDQNGRILPLSETELDLAEHVGAVVCQRLGVLMPW
jgi:hypothetical protein